MQSSKTIFCALALLVIASCNAKPMPAARVPACTSTTEPGTVCRGRVDGAPQRCVQPILPTSAQCPAGLLQVSVALALHLRSEVLLSWSPACASYQWPPSGTVAASQYKQQVLNIFDNRLHALPHLNATGVHCVSCSRYACDWPPKQMPGVRVADDARLQMYVEQSKTD